MGLNIKGRPLGCWTLPRSSTVLSVPLREVPRVQGRCHQSLGGYLICSCYCFCQPALWTFRAPQVAPSPAEEAHQWRQEVGVDISPGQGILGSWGHVSGRRAARHPGDRSVGSGCQKRSRVRRSRKASAVMSPSGVRFGDAKSHRRPQGVSRQRDAERRGISHAIFTS